MCLLIMLWNTHDWFLLIFLFKDLGSEVFPCLSHTLQSTITSLKVIVDGIYYLPIFIMLLFPNTVE